MMFNSIIALMIASSIVYVCQQTPKCIPEYHIVGTYICQYTSAQNIANLGCEVIGATSCTAVQLNDDTKPPKTSSTHFTLTISQKSYTKDSLQIIIKNGVSPSAPILESFSLKYFYPLNVQTRIDCRPQDSTIPSESKYSCVVYISKQNYVLSKSDNSECIVNIPEATAVSSPPYLYSKTYSVVVKDSKKKCGKKCDVELSIPDTDENNSQIKQKINHVTFCQEPILYCDNHDIDSRRIVCKIHVTYPIHHIKLESPETHVELDETKISSSNLDTTKESDVTITYKVNDIEKSDHNFKITFKLYQEETETDANLAFSKEISFQYYLSAKEKPYIQCEISSNQPGGFHSAKYTCNMLSTEQEITISVDKTQYTISPDKSTGTIEKKMYFHTNKEFILSQTNQLCNKHNELTLKFTDGGEVSTIVPHLTTCPEPRIKCHKHDTILSKITCDFEVEYPFTKMEIKTTKADFAIDPSEIPFAQFNLNNNKKLENKVFTYTVSNLLDPNHQFDLKFSFTQSNDEKPHTVTYNFAYVLKENEIPHLSCELHATQPTTPFHAIKYSCSVYTAITSTTLLVKPVNEFDIVHDAIALETDRQLKFKTGIEVTVKRKTIVCGSVKEFEISFSDSQGTYKYVDTHITTCPEPKINCISHDTVSRKIICSFQIPYDAAEILLTSGKSHVRSKDTTFPVKSNVDTPFSIMIGYEIENYSEKDHKFSIQFRVMQLNDNQAYAFSQEFTYVLAIEEQSHIACIPQDDKEIAKFESNSYLCTIVSRRNKVELKTDDKNYVVTPDEVEGNDYKGLKRRQIILTLTPSPVVCRTNKLVELSFEDDSNDDTMTNKKHKYSVNHETICPDPIIDCDEHDVVERIIKCRVQIGFPYVQVKLSATPANRVTLSNSEWLRNAIDSASESKISITYTLLDWSASDHRINIEFQVIQDPGNHEAYSTIRGFSYILKENEKPHITCDSKSSDTTTTTFSAIEYTCSVLTKVNSLNILTSPASYQIQETKPSFVNADCVYKVTNGKYIIKPTEIVCDLTQIVKLYFTDDGIDYSTKISHTTTCPEPTFVYDSHETQDRKITLKTQAPYEFASGTIESDTSMIAVSSSSEGKSSKDTDGDKEEATFVINYEPTDLTKDSITFSMIAKLTLKSGSLKKSKTKSYTVQLTESELPHLKCENQNSLSTDKFTISYYKCEILSRNPNVELILDTPNYVITETSGESFEFKKVYKWKDYKIVIRDNVIKCDKEIALDIKFNYLDGVVNDQLKLTTTCPAPKVSCSNHNQTSRSIICNVLAEFPYTQVEISIISGDVTITSPNSEISAGRNTWSSEHTIEYSLSSLKQTKYDFKFKVSVKQDLHKVETEYSMSYIILDEEKPQITCVAEEINSQSDITTTKYLCYMVTEKDKDVQIKINNTNVELIQSSKKSTTFVDLHKWTDVEVVVRDKIILCHKPIYLTLSIQDNNSKEYNTVVKHTTRCKEISGNCTFLNQQSQLFIVCSFKSEQAFTFTSYSCSEMVECSKQEDTAKANGNENEFIIGFEPRLSSELVEFNLTVTFQYSAKSPVSFNYEFEYSRNSVPVIHGAAKATDSFFGISVVLGVAVVIFIIFFRKKSNKKLDGGDV